MASNSSEILDSDEEFNLNNNSHSRSDSSYGIINDSVSFVIADSDDDKENMSKLANSGITVVKDSDESENSENYKLSKRGKSRIRKIVSSSSDENEANEFNKTEEEINSSINSQDSSEKSQKLQMNNFNEIQNNTVDHSGIIEIVSSDESQDEASGQKDNSHNSSIDQLLGQIEELNGYITKLNVIQSTVNIELLPDKGVKIKKSIKEKERERMKLEQVIKNKLAQQDRVSDKVISNIKPEPPECSSDHENNYSHLIVKTKSTVKTEIKEEDNDLAFFAKPTISTDVDNFGKRAKKTFETQQTLTMDRLETLHRSLVTQPTENVIVNDPKGLKIELMHHQKQALAWLLWRENQNPPGGILADDMGLGKTLTMISLILASKQMSENDSDSDSEEDSSTFVQQIKNLKYKGGTLVVCPASLIQQWEGEIKNRCKKHILDISIFHGYNRETKARRLTKLDVIITTYDTLASEKKKNASLFQIKWKRVILDEAHVIRNDKSLKSQAVCDLVARKRWVLTGTPIQNKESDLYSLMKFLRCSPFDDIRVWKRWVDNKNEAGTQRLSTILKSIMLRRTKKQLQDLGKIEGLPEKFIETIDVELSSDERIVYQKLLLYSQNLFAQFLHQQAEKRNIDGFYSGNYDSSMHSFKNTQFNKAQEMLLKMHAGVVRSHEILVLLLRLRQICCHPILIKAMLNKDDMETNGNLEEGDDGDFDLLSKLNNLNLNDDSKEENLDESIGVNKAVVQNILTSDNPIFHESQISSKVKVTIDIVKKVVDKDEKIVVISQWTSFLQILANCFEKIPGCTYDIFSGKIPVKSRQGIVKAFNNRNKDPKILLLSLMAGGVGLNLVGANHLLILDIHWNPQLELQAHDRVYRFGQDKEVFIYRLLCKDTIEEKVQKLQNTKLEKADNLLLGKNISSKLTIDDLKMLFS